MINHIKQENHEYKKIKFHFLAQAPTHETNTELWLKRQILMYMPIRHIKQTNKGLNKLIHVIGFGRILRMGFYQKIKFDTWLTSSSIELTCVQVLGQ